MSDKRMKLLRKAYLACRPLSELTELLDGFDDEKIPSESSIVREVLHNPVSRKYPPSRSYRLSVTKLLISYLEQRIELGDHLYDELAAIIADSAQESSYVSYELGQGKLECVTLVENRAFVTQGSTGFRSWPAAKILTEVLLLENLGGRKILELGAGVGLTGLVLLRKRAHLKSYIFTDCHPGVLETLKQNVELNVGQNSSRARVELLDWCVGGSVEADLIVGADIVFDKDIIPALVNVIVEAVNRNGCEAIISSVIRNEETYREFYDSVTKELDHEKLNVDEFSCFENVDDPYEVLKLSKKKMQGHE